jgi:hypothetical protein
MFGEEIWVVITVAEGGALGLTQAMHATGIQPSFMANHGESDWGEATEPQEEANDNDLGFGSIFRCLKHRVFVLSWFFLLNRHLPLSLLCWYLAMSASPYKATQHNYTSTQFGTSMLGSQPVRLLACRIVGSLSCLL